MRKKLLVILLLLVVLIVLVVTRCGGKKDQQNDPVDGQGFAQQSGKAELPASGAIPTAPEQSTARNSAEVRRISKETTKYNLLMSLLY